MSDIMIPDGREIKAIFKPRARLLLQLGDQLIKNESIALIELVKNSYDADANRVEIYLEKVDSIDDGMIIIEDNGYGMNADTVVNVWMEPGSDFKSSQFLRRELSPKYKRLPIGEKGIGRFGVHKLGNHIEMTSKKDGCKEVFVKIDWSDFEKYKYLNEVPIVIIERDKPLLFKDGRTGTSIIINKLRKQWTRGVARTVKRTISSLVSPFESVDDFDADFYISEKEEWFKGLLDWKDVKEFSLYNFKVTINQGRIETFSYKFTPWSTMTKIDGRDIDINDSLISEFKTILVPMETDEEKQKGKKKKMHNLHDYKIGRYVFEGYIFSRDSFALKLGVSDKTGYTEYLNKNSGIRVFRSGLRVYDYGEPENDWLGLDLRRVNQPSRKLSNNIVIGAIYLERDSSTDLVEKTNREGFVENNAYDAFKKTILYVLELIEIKRFQDRQRLWSIYGSSQKSEPVLHVIGDLKEYIEKHITDVMIRNEIVQSLNQIEDEYKKMCDTLLKAAGAGLSMSVVIHEIEKIILEIQKVVKIEKSSDRVVMLINHLSKLVNGYTSIIRKTSQTSENIKDIIEQALANTEYRLESHKIQVIEAFKKNQDYPKLKLPKSLIVACIMNIIDNSIYWLEKKGANEKKIYINVFDDGDLLSIAIADNGTGFLLPTGELSEPFVSAKPDGMGLGLHIANEVMLAQKGKLAFPEWGDYNIPDDFKSGALITLSFKK